MEVSWNRGTPIYGNLHIEMELDKETHVEREREERERERAREGGREAKTPKNRVLRRNWHEFTGFEVSCNPFYDYFEDPDA